MTTDAGSELSLGHSQAHAHELWPAAIQPHIATVCRFNGLPHIIHFSTGITTQLLLLLL